MSDSVKPITHIVQIQNVSLETYERAVYSCDFEKASVLLLEGLRKLKAGAEFIGYQTTPALKQVLYTRFCAATIALLANPDYRLSQEGFVFYASEHAIMDTVFRASAFSNSDHLLAQMAVDPAEKDAAKIKFADAIGLTKYMMTHSLRSGFKMNFEEAFRKDPQITFPLYIGMLTAMHLCSPVAQERKEYLLGLSDIFKDVSLTEVMVSSMSDAYMYCSYAFRPDKHTFKSLVHRLYARMMEANGFKEHLAPLAPRPKQKPVMVIPVEWFTSLHAMYRCYAPVVRQLRTKFHLVGVGRPHAIDAESVKEFDTWVPVKDDNIALATIIEDIRKHKPAVIYYPSIGMDLVWVALSSIRLAPLQIMTLGHPASSHSPAIDYALCEEGDVFDEELFTEQVVALPEGSLFRFVMRPDADLPAKQYQREDPEVVKIAVPAMMLKLNATFLETLVKIRDKASRPVEFHFWPNMVALNMYQAAREIREILPHAFIYERCHYNEYMRQLQQCHVQLGTFPFGGTNSNIDCMLLGIPLVCLVGPEPHSTVDAKMSRKVGLPEWLTATSIDEYVEAAVRLIVNGPERVRISKYLLEEADVAGVFFNENKANTERHVVDAVWRIYKERCDEVG